MSQYPSDADMMQNPNEPKKGWFGRNWLWFVPTLILVPILCCCGGGGAMLWFGLGKVFELPPYKDSVALMEQDPDVQQALGTPITSPKGFGDLIAMMQDGGAFNMEQVNSTIDFDADIPVSGPNGTGRLIIVAQSTDGGVTWVYTTQRVDLPDGTAIDFLNPGNAPPTPGEEAADQE
ncbi:MAG: cytochrome c oxidase assembly factor Coa1 family protein [Phycisphaeraceae bacterium]